MDTKDYLTIYSVVSTCGNAIVIDMLRRRWALQDATKKRDDADRERNDEQESKFLSLVITTDEQIRDHLVDWCAIQDAKVKILTEQNDALRDERIVTHQQKADLEYEIVELKRIIQKYTDDTVDNENEQPR